MKKILRKVKQSVNDARTSIELNQAMKKEKVTAGMSDELSILLLCHSLEKGMGLEKVRKGFGQEKAKALVNVLDRTQNVDSYEFREGMSVLKVWLEYSESQNVDVCLIREKFERIVQDRAYKENKAGVEFYSPQKEVYECVDEQSVKKFIQNRHSVRSYKKEKVSEELMHEVLELASSAPSACNRQPSKVYWTSDENTVSEIDKCVPGNKGFENAVPNWAIITSNRKMFGKTESLQWYVNGGIFVSYFIQALQLHGIGSCIFQIPITFKTIPQIRKIANIPQNEAIVCMIGFGYPKDEVKHIMADRRKAKEIGVKF